MKIITAAAIVLAALLCLSLFMVFAGVGFGDSVIWFLAFLISSIGFAVVLIIAALRVKSMVLKLVLIIGALIVAVIAIAIFATATAVVCDPVHPPNGNGPVVCDPVHQPNP